MLAAAPRHGGPAPAPQAIRPPNRAPGGRPLAAGGSALPRTGQQTVLLPAG